MTRTREVYEIRGEYTVMVWRTGGLWYYDVVRDGKPIGSGGNFPTRRAAEKRADKLIAEANTPPRLARPQ